MGAYDDLPPIDLAQPTQPGGIGPQAIAGPTGAPGTQTGTLGGAIEAALPSAGEVGEGLLRRGEYVGERFLRGVSSAAHEDHPDAFPLWYAHPGPAPDPATGVAGAYAEDFARNPLLTAMTPVKSLIQSGVGEIADELQLPEWEKMAASGITGLLQGRETAFNPLSIIKATRNMPPVRAALLKANVLDRILSGVVNPRNLRNMLWSGAAGAELGGRVAGEAGAKIGGAIAGAAPAATQLVRRMANNPLGAILKPIFGAYQAQPTGNFPTTANDLTRPSGAQ